MSAGYTDILIKSALRGLLIAVLLVLARLGKHVITGLLISVPAISLYTWWWVGTRRRVRPGGPRAVAARAGRRRRRVAHRRGPVRGGPAGEILTPVSAPGGSGRTIAACYNKATPEWRNRQTHGT